MKAYFWALITLIIAIILAIVLLNVTREDSSKGQPQIYSGIPLDVKLLPLERRALDEAYHAHMLLLISVWLKDSAGDPTRFNKGLKIARRAYHQMLEKLDQRQLELEKDNDNRNK